VQECRPPAAGAASWCHTVPHGPWPLSTTVRRA
jgi:hypothetical protein